MSLEDRIPCPHCGFLNKPDAEYCELCQKPLKKQASKSKRINFAAIPGAPVKHGRIDFYQVISKNKRNTFLLVTLFVILFASVGAAIGYLNGSYETGIIISTVIAIVWVTVSLLFGDKISLKFMNAHKISHDDEPRLFNVVEEMSIAAGIPMPEIYVIESDGMNAFSVGFKPEKSAIAVTRGLLKNLTREELQGVIGHEISHIRFYDTRLMVTISVLAGIIVIFSDVALRSYFGFGRRRYYRRSRERTGEGNILILVLMIIFIAVSPVIATILQMAISRKREYLADAGSVELTRNPAGLRKALEKLKNGNVYIDTASRGNQHLFIVNPLKADRDIRDTLFETHPPIDKRIEILRAMEA